VLYCIFPLLIGFVLLAVALLILGFTIWGFAKKNWIVAFVGSWLLVAGGLWIAVLAMNIQRASEYAGTRKGMEQVGQSLRRYHEKKGSFPAGFQLIDLEDPSLPWPESGYGFRLSFSEHSFQLTSWGRDGKPGGVKYDQDIIVSWKAGDLSVTTEAAPD
jgi:hypothetical protein